MKCAKEMSNLIQETREQLLLTAIQNTSKMAEHILNGFASQIANDHNLTPSYSFYIAQISRTDDLNFINQLYTNKYDRLNGYSGTVYHYAALIDILTSLHYTITIQEKACCYLDRDVTKLTISIPSSLPCD